MNWIEIVWLNHSQLNLSSSRFCNFYSLQKFSVYIVRIRVCMRIQIYWRYKEMSRLMLCNLGNASTAGNDTNNNANTNSSMEDDDYYPLPTIYRWVNSWSITIYIFMYSYINRLLLIYLLFVFILCFFIFILNFFSLLTSSMHIYVYICIYICMYICISHISIS